MVFFLDIERSEYTYPSSTGIADIYARSWAPKDKEKVKGVLQIAHGMAEHGERYEGFAHYMADKGYAVFANDHIGHGKSMNDFEERGFFGLRDGWLGFVNDAKALTDLAREKYPDIPVILFGHSMGSFIARGYCEKFGEQLDGAIFCGTSGKNPLAGIAVQMASFIATVKGHMYRSKFINKAAFGAFNKRIENPKTDFDWLSRDEEEVDKYMNDKFCGFLFTAVGYRDMSTILQKVSGKSWYQNLPPDLPMLLVSGQMDPVGDYGKGVQQVFRDLRKSGHKNVLIKLYKDDRHEILNELDKEDVYKDLEQWCDKLLE
ncbi:MAG: alpha/beta hydrolase [Clostridiales bacterium]|nr:alpha/beta hydrolase [Clostridiales bacterium]